MRTLSLAQGSSDWLEWRNRGLGSSDAPVLLNGSHFGKTVLDLWYEKVNGREGKPSTARPENSAMKRGKRKEGPTRKLYEDWTGHQAIPLCAVHDTHEFLKASFDGWVAEEDLVVEIKAPGVRKDGTSDHEEALLGRVPDKYRPQLLHLCLVAGTNRAHYVSYGDPRHFPGVRSFRIVPFEAGEQELAHLLKVELAFWGSVLSGRPPTI